VKAQFKKILYLLSPVMLVSFATEAMAQQTTGQVNTVPAVNLSIQQVYQTFVNVMNWVFSFAIVLAVILIIVGGVSYMTAGGDDTKLGTAKKRIIWGLVGAAIVIVAWGLISLIANFFNANIQKPG
jgi:hypothetical protein